MARSAKTSTLNLASVAPISRLEPGDFVVFCRDQRLPVEPSPFYRPAKTFRILEFVGESAGIDEKLFRHASADHACAADPILFRYCNARAMTCGDACSPDAAGSCTDDKKIVIEFRHASVRMLRKHYFGSAGAGLGWEPALRVASPWRSSRYTACRFQISSSKSDSIPVSTSMPFGPAMMPTSAIPRKRPLSTTPGTSFRASSSASGSSIAPKAQSRIWLPLSVRKARRLRQRAP